MAIPRALYITFYVLYLVTMAIALWFLLYYSAVPAWVFTFFVAAILIFIVGLLIKEFLLKRTITTDGKNISPSSTTIWTILYIIFHIIAFGLMIVGLFFAIKYSTIPWWTWLILVTSIIFSVITTMIYAIAPNAIIAFMIFAIITLIMFVVAMILLIVYSKSPWWTWLITGAAIIFGLISIIFEIVSEKNQKIIEVKTGKVTIRKSSDFTTIKKQVDDSRLLPSNDIPEQIV